MRYDIFVRGLNYATRELTLARYIEQVAEVEDVRIPMAFNRTKGYAFVRLKDSSKTDEVIEKLNGKNLDSRYLEFSRAKAPSELPAKQQPASRFYPRRAPRYPAFRGGFRPRASFPPRAPAAGPFGKPRYKRGPNPERTESQYTVAVRNLPYVAEEEDMHDLFEGFTVVASKISRGPGGKSMGVAFVTLISHEEQQRAIQTVNGNIVEERPVRVVEAFLLPDELEEEKRSLESYPSA